MYEPGGIGKLLIIAGILITLIGVILFFAPKIPWIGRLPGDIYIKKDDFSFYFPITTCIAISALLSLLFYVFKR